MNKRKILGFVFIFLAVVTAISNARTTGAFIGTTLSNSLSLVSVVLFLVGGFLILSEKLENRVTRSRVKEDPLLLKVAEDIGRKEPVKRDINHLIEMLNKGDTNPGIGTRTIAPNIFELRARNGGRVYYRKVGKEEYEILGYSDKDKQDRVISRIKKLYS